MSYSDGTRAVHAGLPEPVVGEPFLPGPVFAAPYHLDPVEGPGENGYARTEHPTRRQLEAAIGELEGGRTLVFSSGQAAITALLLAVLRTGDTLAVPSDGYFTVRAFAEGTLRDLGVKTVLVPTAGPYPDFSGVRLVLLESPANPGLDVCDIRAVAAAAQAAGALVAVDNTTATPLGQNPLALGADVVVASGTKALTGHSDVLLGYVSTNDAAVHDKVETWRKQTGAVPSLESHPLKFYFDYGLRVTINTDNRLITDTTVTKELWLSHKEMGLSLEDLTTIIVSGFKSAFLPFREKQDFLREVNEEIAQTLATFEKRPVIVKQPA